MSTATLTTAAMKLAPSHVVRKTESPIGVGKCKAYACKASLTLQLDWGKDGKAAYWLRFDKTSAELQARMTEAKWRHVDTRDGWWALVTPDSAAFVVELTGIRVQAPKASEPAPKAAPAKTPSKTPAKAPVTQASTPKAEPVKAPVTQAQAPAPKAAPEKQPSISDLTDAELCERITRYTRMAAEFAEILAARHPKA